MAGSGFPPLTNIPYCCLPQESGPCLSTSVGDRPLRSPSHRRLGGPSPRQPANGTHARPRPRRRFALLGMPQLGFMPYYPAFPPAIRPTGVGCIRVTHPSATLAAPKGRLPSDLHVLGLPLAFSLSQDQTLRCTIVLLNLFLCISGSAFRHRALAPWPFLFLILPTSRYRDASCAGLRLSKIGRSRIPLCLSPPFRPKAGAKVQLFPLRAMLFFIFFSSFPQSPVSQEEKFNRTTNLS